MKSGDTGAVATLARLTIAPPAPTVAAGGHRVLCVTLRNTGAVADRYSVVVEGIPAAWCRVDRLSFLLDAGAVRHLSLRIHPPATAEPVVGVALTVQALSHQARAVQASATAALTVRSSGRRAPVRLGNAPEAYRAPWPQALTRRGRPRGVPHLTSAAVFVALLALVAVAFVYALTVPEPGEFRAAAGAPASVPLPYIQQFQQQRAVGAPAGALTWRVSGAATVTLNGRLVAATGTRALARGDTTATYELRAANGQGAVVSRVSGAGARGRGMPTGPGGPRGPGRLVAVLGGAGGPRAGLGRPRRPGAGHSPRRRPQQHARLVTRAPHRRPIVRAWRRSISGIPPAVGAPARARRRPRRVMPQARVQARIQRLGDRVAGQVGRSLGALVWRARGAADTGGAPLHRGRDARGRRGGCGSSCRRAGPDAGRAVRSGAADHRAARAMGALGAREWAIIRRAIPRRPPGSGKVPRRPITTV